MYKFAYQIINRKDERKHELILIKYLDEEKDKTRAENLIRAHIIRIYKDKTVYMVGLDDKNNIATSSVQDTYSIESGLTPSFSDVSKFERA
jgi:hypothetical protein